jgi:GTP cyclohydrolase II|tara:strand:- start:3610 stop:4656 length:1047 start_codon:yes stop_codon:yes gene_type:complete
MRTEIDILQNELEFDRPIKFDSKIFYLNPSLKNLKKISLKEEPKMLMPGYFLNFHNISEIKPESYYQINIKKIPKNTNLLFDINFKINIYFDLNSLRVASKDEIKIFKIFKSFNLIPFPLFIGKKNNLSLFNKAEIFNMTTIYSRLNKTNVIYRDEIELPINKGKNTRLFLFQDKINNHTHYVIQFQRKSNNSIPNIRIHSSCLTGDLMGSMKCDCGHQLDKAIEYIDKSKEGGYLFYLNQEGRGLGIHNKILSYKLQSFGIDTYKADNILGYSGDERNYFAAIQIFKYLKIKSLNLITNNPSKISALKKSNINVKKMITIKSNVNKFNKKYMETKKILGNHQINLKK